MAVIESTAGVRKARSPQDLEAVSRLLAAGFQDDPVLAWTIPDTRRRRELLPPTFALFVEALARHGETYLSDDGAGAALWVPPEAESMDEHAAEKWGQRLSEVMGPDTARMVELMAALDEHHPHGSLYYLNLVAVDPQRQGQGVGSMLLEHVLERCDREETPAYLEATSEGGKRLYERHGFEALEPFTLPGGPPLYPMWRQPS